MMFQPIKQRGKVVFRHIMGWSVELEPFPQVEGATTVHTLLETDPLWKKPTGRVRSDLHFHSTWSDGAASLDGMSGTAASLGMTHVAVTDHSRSSKLQRGLTPVEWLRQSNSLRFRASRIPILRSTEVDILRDGRLDLPNSLLLTADIVVASVHTGWAQSKTKNTVRLIRAIQSGCVDILGHPTGALVGKPGVPNFVRDSADVDWAKVFATCAEWRVAVEFNCFPSRFDLSERMLRSALDAGCWISLGSDAHARAHLAHIQFGDEMARRLQTNRVLNYLTIEELRAWREQALSTRVELSQVSGGPDGRQQQLLFTDTKVAVRKVRALATTPASIPSGNAVVGLDLTGGKKATGVAFLSESTVETCSLTSDDELVAYVAAKKPSIVCIDSPLGLPGGGEQIDPNAGIVRRAEHDLSSIGIPAYPALIDSMRELTLRGIRLKKRIESLENSPTVIESYPGAAQDILCLPRKQRNLKVLLKGLGKLGLTGPGLETNSHDEIDAITSAVVGRYFEAGTYEPMGIPSESCLIVPKHQLLEFSAPPVVCLAGPSGAGKSVVARYLAVIYGFQWCKTRDLVRELLIDDCLLYTSPSPRDKRQSRMPSSA